MWWAARLLIALTLGGGPVFAEPIMLGGLVFSDELGGLVLHEGWGSGTLDDPFVLVEEITGDGPAILVIRGLTAEFGNRIRTHHQTGFALTKVVINATEERWPGFSLELQEQLGSRSPYGDGLSFGQASRFTRQFASDGFAASRTVDEPADGVTFSNGDIAPGARVSLHFVISDTTPRHEFFLLQSGDHPVAALPAVTEEGG